MSVEGKGGDKSPPITRTANIPSVSQEEKGASDASSKQGLAAKVIVAVTSESASALVPQSYFQTQEEKQLQDLEDEAERLFSGVGAALSPLLHVSGDSDDDVELEAELAELVNTGSSAPKAFTSVDLSTYLYEASLLLNFYNQGYDPHSAFSHLKLAENMAKKMPKDPNDPQNKKRIRLLEQQIAKRAENLSVFLSKLITITRRQDETQLPVSLVASMQRITTLSLNFFAKHECAEGVTVCDDYLKFLGSIPQQSSESVKPTKKGPLPPPKPSSRDKIKKSDPPVVKSPLRPLPPLPITKPLPPIPAQTKSQASTPPTIPEIDYEQPGAVGPDSSDGSSTMGTMEKQAIRASMEMLKGDLNLFLSELDEGAVDEDYKTSPIYLDASRLAQTITTLLTADFVKFKQPTGARQMLLECLQACEAFCIESKLTSTLSVVKKLSLLLDVTLNTVVDVDVGAKRHLVKADEENSDEELVEEFEETMSFTYREEPSDLKNDTLAVGDSSDSEPASPRPVRRVSNPAISYEHDDSIDVEKDATASGTKRPHVSLHGYDALKLREQLKHLSQLHPKLTFKSTQLMKDRQLDLADGDQVKKLTGYLSTLLSHLERGALPKFEQITEVLEMAMAIYSKYGITDAELCCQVILRDLTKPTASDDEESLVDTDWQFQLQQVLSLQDFSKNINLSGISLGKNTQSDGRVTHGAAVGKLVPVVRHSQLRDEIDLGKLQSQIQALCNIHMGFYLSIVDNDATNPIDDADSDEINAITTGLEELIAFVDLIMERLQGFANKKILLITKEDTDDFTAVLDFIETAAGVYQKFNSNTAAGAYCQNILDCLTESGSSGESILPRRSSTVSLDLFQWHQQHSIELVDRKVPLQRVQELVIDLVNAHNQASDHLDTHLEKLCEQFSIDLSAVISATPITANEQQITDIYEHGKKTFEALSEELATLDDILSNIIPDDGLIAPICREQLLVCVEKLKVLYKKLPNQHCVKACESLELKLIYGFDNDWLDLEDIDNFTRVNGYESSVKPRDLLRAIKQLQQEAEQEIDDLTQGVNNPNAGGAVNQSLLDKLVVQVTQLSNDITKISNKKDTLSADDFLFLHKQLKKLQNKARKCKLPETQELARLLKLQVKYQWLRIQEDKEFERLYKKYKFLDDIGSNQVDKVGGDVHVGTSFGSVGDEKIGPYLQGNVGAFYNHKLANDDEGSFLDSKSMGIRLGAEGGISTGLGDVKKVGIAEFAARLKAKAVFLISHSRGKFRKYNHNRDYWEKHAAKRGWANMNQARTQSKFKKLLWKVPKFLDMGSDLGNMKKVEDKVTSSNQRVNALLRGTSFNKPERKDIHSTDGGMHETEVKLTADASYGLVLGKDKKGLNLDAGGGIEVKGNWLNAHEILATNVMEMAKKNPERLREIDMKYSKWLRGHLGIEQSHQLWIDGVDASENDRVNPLETTQRPNVDKHIQASLVQEVAFRKASTEQHMLGMALGKLSDELENLTELTNHAHYIRNIKQPTDRQKEMLKNAETKLKEVYRTFGVPLGKNSKEKVLRNMAVCCAHIVDLLGEGTDYQDELDRLVALLEKPEMPHDKVYLKKLTNFKFKADVNYSRFSLGGHVQAGPVDGTAKVTFWKGDHPHRVRDGSFIDVEFSGKLTAGLQRTFTGAEFESGLKDMMMEQLTAQGITANLHEAFIRDVMDFDITASGEWGIHMRLYKPSYTKDENYNGKGSHHLQFVRQFFKWEAGLDRGFSLPINPGLHAGAAADMGRERKRITNEKIGGNDLSYPSIVYNRLYRTNNNQHGHPQWSEFKESNHEKFGEIFKNIASGDGHIRDELDFFFKNELVPNAQKVSDQEGVKIQSFYYYLLECMKVYEKSPSDENWDKCMQCLERYFVMLQPGWFEHHRSTWEEIKFGNKKGRSVQEIQNKLSRMFNLK